MPDRREKAIAHARRVLATNAGLRAASTEVEKTIWGSPAGKKRLADRLVAMLPAHKTYVCGFRKIWPLPFRKIWPPLEGSQGWSEA